MIRQRLLTPLHEAAKSPTDLPDGYSVVIEKKSEWIEISIFKDGVRSKRDLWGSVHLEEPDWNCGDALFVSYSGAAHGWGPLLYDVALEYASKVAGGLVSDRETVTGEAEDIWRYYNTRRADVKKSQLDDTENTLTPAQRDNCRQGSAEELPEPWQSDKNPLSKLYIKRPARVMTKLKKLKKLVLRV